ncbi:MAG: VWA domain-containing protein [Polyangiales bacterium]
MIENRDYTLILDKSGSMAQPDARTGRSRWNIVQESTLALASRCEQLDPDGLTVYLFNGRFKRYDNVRTDTVAKLFRENEPMGSTNLAGVLDDAFAQYFARKTANRAGHKPETILVVTDGEPDDPRAVMKVIIEASRKLERDEELAVSFVQVGDDPGAARFLKALDDDLGRAGARFDIVDTLTITDLEDRPLSEVLLDAIRD